MLITLIKSTTKERKNIVVLVIMSSSDSILEYCRYETDGCHMIGPYMHKCHCESFFSIDLNRNHNDIEEESLEETAVERNTCIYDSHDFHVLKVRDTVMNIENVTEPGIVITFEYERNNVLMKVGCIEMNIFSMNKVHYGHPNNPTLINTLA